MKETSLPEGSFKKVYLSLSDLMDMEVSESFASEAVKVLSNCTVENNFQADLWLKQIKRLFKLNVRESELHDSLHYLNYKLHVEGAYIEPEKIELPELIDGVKKYKLELNVPVEKELIESVLRSRRISKIHA